MDEKFPEILRRLIKERGLTREQVAKLIGVSRPMVHYYESGSKPPSRKRLIRISEVFGVPLDMLVGKKNYERTPFSVRITYSKRFEEPALPQERESDYLPVPIVEPKVAAGNPQMISSEEVVDVAFIHRRALKRRSAENLLCTFVQGDSMHPVIRDGAIVCIDTKARPEEKKVPKGSIWAVRKDEGAVVKFIQIGEDMIALLSANPSYPPEAVEDPEAIIGRVVWMWQAV